MNSLSLMQREPFSFKSKGKRLHFWEHCMCHTWGVLHNNDLVLWCWSAVPWVAFSLSLSVGESNIFWVPHLKWAWTSNIKEHIYNPRYLMQNVYIGSSNLISENWWFNILLEFRFILFLSQFAVVCLRVCLSLQLLGLGCLSFHLYGEEGGY